MDSNGVAFIAGFIVPFIVSFLKDLMWSAKVKQLVALVVCIVIGAGVTIIDQGIVINNWDTFVQNFTIIFTTAQIWYIQYFENTNVNMKLEDLKVLGSKEEE